jgi:hypothetical protein
MADNVVSCGFCGHRSPSRAPRGGASAHNTPGGFYDAFYGYGGSRLFITGASLLTAGSVLGFFVNISFALILSIALIALPTAALFMIFANSRKERGRDKTLFALTLLRIHAFINLVGFCLITAAAAAFFVYAAFHAAAYEPVAGVVVIFAAILVMSVMILYLFLYYLAFLRIVTDLRAGAADDRCLRIRGVRRFTVMSGISVFFGLAGSVFALRSWEGISYIYERVVWDIEDSLASAFGEGMFGSLPDMPGFAAMAASAAFGAVSYAGTVLLLIILNKFNRRMQK